MGGPGSGRRATRPAVERLPQLRAPRRGPGDAPAHIVARGQAVRLVEVVSNLGLTRGPLRLVCPGCEAPAVVLYAVQAGWRCRRCARPVYRSSRRSDARISALLAGQEPSVTPPPPLDPSAPLAPQLAPRLAIMGVLLRMFDAYDRLGRPHGGQGRPWSAARRRAQRKD